MTPKPRHAQHDSPLNLLGRVTAYQSERKMNNRAAELFPENIIVQALLAIVQEGIYGDLNRSLQPLMFFCLQLVPGFFVAFGRQTLARLASSSIQTCECRRVVRRNMIQCSHAVFLQVLQDKYDGFRLD